MKIQTPWGISEGCVQTDVEGIEFHHTASHGGYWVSDELSGKLVDSKGEAIGAGLEAGSRGGTWWEEDCSWAFVARAFPDAFPPEAQADAIRTLQWLTEGSKR